MTEIALMKAREKLTGLSRELQENPKTVVRMTNRGKPAMTLMSAELYDTLVETLDVLSDRATLDALRRSLRDIQSGKVHSLDPPVADRVEIPRACFGGRRGTPQLRRALSVPSPASRSPSSRGRPWRGARG